MDRPVSHVMTRDLVTVNEDASILEAERLLIAHRIHGAPVVDARGRLVGVVSQTDLLRWHAGEIDDGSGASGSASAGPATTVGEVMTAAAHAVRPETSAAVAAALMIRRKMHRLLVVDEDLAPIGIVCAIDLLRLLPHLERQLERGRDPFAGDIDAGRRKPASPDRAAAR